MAKSNAADSASAGVKPRPVLLHLPLSAIWHSEWTGVLGVSAIPTLTRGQAQNECERFRSRSATVLGVGAPRCSQFERGSAPLGFRFFFFSPESLAKSFLAAHAGRIAGFLSYRLH